MNQASPEQLEQEFEAIFQLPTRAVSPKLSITTEDLLEQFFPGAFERKTQALSPAEVSELSPQKVVVAVSRKEQPPVKAEQPIAQKSQFQRTLDLAQLYIDQGYAVEARELLERLLSESPENVEIKRKLEALRLSAMEHLSPEELLERWIVAIGVVKQRRSLAVLG